jgi:hypothetical protein
MTYQLLYAALGLLLLATAAALLRRPGAAEGAGIRRSPEPAEYFPVHCRYFLQMRQALSPEDGIFLSGRASPEVYRRWKKGRRRAGRLYLAGLREDFARLNSLARVLSRYSPQIKARQEGELLWLNLRFQLLYRTVVLRILLGWPAAEDLGQMASLIGGWGSRLEQAALTLDLPGGAITP